MRPDYPVGLKNGLIDDKHRQAMGGAVWIYLWFIDRQSKHSDKVLGGKPIRYAEIRTSYPSLSPRMYNTYIDALRRNGYITTTRTPRGLVIEIIKPKKWSDTKKTAYQKASDRKKTAYPIGKKPHIQYKSNSISNSKNSNKGAIAPSSELDLYSDNLPDIDIETTDDLTENRRKPKNERRDMADINGIVAKFEITFGFKLKRIAKQRITGHNLVRRYGADAVLSAIDAAYLAKDERYAPQILNLEDLWEKWESLESYYRRRAKDQQSKVAVIGDGEE